MFLQIRSAMPIQDMNTSAPIRRGNAYVKSCSKRKQKYWVLERNGMLKFKMTPDRHNPIQNLNYYLRPDPPLFSLPSTFKPTWRPNLQYFSLVLLFLLRELWFLGEGWEPVILLLLLREVLRVKEPDRSSNRARSVLPCVGVGLYEHTRRSL